LTGILQRSSSCENSNKYYCLHAENSNDFWTLDRKKIGTNYSRNTEEYTKSSTEAELVGVDDTLGYILWAGYFMIEQGYDMD